MLSRKEHERWLHGRKVHGVLNDRIACRPSYSLASGFLFVDRCSKEHYDLRKVTCRVCRKALQNNKAQL